MRMKTISPIIAHIKQQIDGKLKTWDLGPADERFYESIQKNLINKYISFHGNYDGERWIKLTPDIKTAKRRRIDIKGDYHRCYMMNFEIEADQKLIEFSYDCGLGEKNSMGFGMIEQIMEVNNE